MRGFFSIGFLIIFLFWSENVTFGSDVVIELKIEKNDILNPGSKKDLWFSLINHSDKDFRILNFRNGIGAAWVIFLIDSDGNLVKSIYLPPSQEKSGGLVQGSSFWVSSHATSGGIIQIKNFFVQKKGIYYMIYAIPALGKPGIILSSPVKLDLSSDGLIDSLTQILFNEIPQNVKKGFRIAIEKRLIEEKIPLDSFKIPF
ncbi:MAG: hypothetical protein HQM08_13370 [Candidatus Riflebacteria bacterium]|nr:hypothetical protein [Candidatus Riflebacteria bacterium]